MASRRLWAKADLELGRERLLAGDAADAGSAFASAGRWPGVRALARAGETMSAARAGRRVSETLAPETLAFVPGEPLLVSAIRAGQLEAAGALADVLRRSGDLLGGLYAAALAFEAGDESAARSAVAGSGVPFEARGLGVRLVRALQAREAGARTLLLDRRGELVAALPASDSARPDADAAPLVAGVLGRLGAVPEARALRLTIDLELSRAAQLAIGGRRGSIVLVEARSGSVLAAVSDARTAAIEPAAAFEERREPASIAKLLTAAAAYRSGLDADAAISHMTCTGVARYGGKLLWCAHPGGPLAGLDDALAQSCNIAFANLGVGLGAARLEDEYRRWGFDAGPGALLGAAGRVHTPPLTPRQLADLSIGLEHVDVTPLHATLLAAVVANDGRLPEPRLAAGACGPLGLSSERPPPPVEREVIDPRIARRLRQAMEAVARGGTGAGLAPTGYAVAMKTGTASEPGHGYHVNYIGFARLGETPVAFCVRVTHEPTSPAVTVSAHEVTRRLLQALADRSRGPRAGF